MCGEKRLASICIRGRQTLKQREGEGARSSALCSWAARTNAGLSAGGTRRIRGCKEHTHCPVTAQPLLQSPSSEEPSQGVKRHAIIPDWSGRQEDNSKHYKKAPGVPDLAVGRHRGCPAICRTREGEGDTSADRGRDGRRRRGRRDGRPRPSGCLHPGVVHRCPTRAGKMTRLSRLLSKGQRGNAPLPPK